MTKDKENIKAVTPKTAGKNPPVRKSPVKDPVAKATGVKKPSAGKTGKTVTVKQVRSGAGRLPAQIATLKGLGLNKMNRTRTLEDTTAVRGMIAKVQHLVEVVDAA